MARSEIQFTAANAAGDGQVVSVTVTHRSTGANASIYADEVGPATQSNPTITDSSGRIRGWLDEGSYNLAFGAPLSYTRAIEINRGDGVTKIVDNAVTTNKFANSAVTQGKIAAGTLATAKFVDNSITEPKIATGALDSRTQAANAIATANILDGAVSTRALASTITNAEIAAGAVGGSILTDGGVTVAKLADNSATTPKINDGAVTTEKLAANVITNAKVAPGTIPLRAVSGLPIGTILPFLGNVLPSAEWVWCDGSAISRTTYSLLFATIGLTYGGSGTTFNVPDLRGRTAYGFSTNAHPDVNALGKNDGIAFGSRYPQHGHTLSGVSVGGGGHGHTMETAVSGAKGSYNYASPCYAEWFPRRYLGLYSEWLSTGGEHGHSMGGTVGDISGDTGDTPAYFVINFIMRAQ